MAIKSTREELYEISILNQDAIRRVFAILMTLPDYDIELYVWARFNGLKDTILSLEKDIKRIRQERLTDFLEQRKFTLNGTQHQLLNAEGFNVLVREANAGKASMVDNLLAEIEATQTQLTTLAQQLRRRRDVLLQEEAIQEHVRGMPPEALVRYSQAIRDRELAIASPGA